MSFKTFTAGVLTASEVNTYLMNQSVIVCTSATRPGSPNEGMTIYETDTDYYKVYSGSTWEDVLKAGAWTTYTPTISSSGGGTNWVLGNGTVEGAYQKIGRLVVGWASVTFGTTTTFGTNVLYVNGPVACRARTASEWAAGECRSVDISPANSYLGNVWMPSGSSTLIALGVHATSGTYASNSAVTSTVPFTWTNGDYFTVNFQYEAAA